MQLDASVHRAAISLSIGKFRKRPLLIPNPDCDTLSRKQGPLSRTRPTKRSLSHDLRQLVVDHGVDAAIAT